MFLAQQEIGIVFIYCRYDDQENQSVTSFMGSFLQQLVERRRILDPEIKEMYEKHAATRSRPNATTFLTLIEAQIEKMDRVYVVIDALDECQEKTRADLLNNINKLSFKTNVFLTSRHNTRVEQYLRPREMNNLEIRAAPEDIKTYIQARFLLESDRHSCLDAHLQIQPYLREEILEGVIGKTNGM
jgi:predicted DNA-binding protein